MEFFLWLMALYIFFGIINVCLNGDILDSSGFNVADMFTLGIAWPLFALLWIVDKTLKFTDSA